MIPKVSIVVCTFNREKYIGKCLEHLKKQTVEKDFYEVIVINNNSTDSTDQICKDFILNNNADNFHYFIEINQGHSYSRNRGIKESKADLINFIDDDAFVCSDFVKNILDFFETHSEAVAIGGKINPIFEGEKPKWMTPFLMPLVSALNMGNNIKLFKGRKFPIGANMSFRKKVFQKYGLFNVELGRKGSGLEGGDEKEVFLRLKKDKQKIYYVPNVEVDHVIPQSRIEIAYIRGLAKGVARSEQKRLHGLPIEYKLLKVANELMKIGGTFVLSIVYYLKFAPAKANMLMRFRYWVIRGYFKDL